MTNQANQILNNLSEQEREQVLKILSEYQEKGASEQLNKIKYQDYKEIPVDIITFIKDRQYLGDAWHDSKGKCKLYPYWEKRLKELFPDNISIDYNSSIFTGSRGLGKSEMAVTIGLYLMYRVMCLKNPHDYFGLKPTEKIAFAFLNITIELAENIGVAKFQETVKLSPWFMERGTITPRSNMWQPPSYINIIIGSQSSDVIGQAILFCLDGDTVILTQNGEHKLKDLVDRPIVAPTMSNSGELVYSDVCTVKPTIKTDEQYVIELEDGTIIKCTPNHRFMLTDGSYKEAKDLTEQDEIMGSDGVINH